MKKQIKIQMTGIKRRNIFENLKNPEKLKHQEIQVATRAGVAAMRLQTENVSGSCYIPSK